VVVGQASRTGRNPPVIPIATADYPTAARRPANSQLDCGLFARTFGFSARHWSESVDATVVALAVAPERQVPGV
jgi:dTDP-4-dehydrorhamnose reductase